MALSGTTVNLQLSTVILKIGHSCNPKRSDISNYFGAFGKDTPDFEVKLFG